MDREKREIYTIGHSTHTLEYFLELLQAYNIDTLVDVRSTPASGYNPQFNKDVLESFLKQNNIKYMHFKDEFGARQTDESILEDDGCVNFELFRKTYQFQNGIERLDIGISKGYKIALMCAEGNPLECHRFSMISVYLEEIGITVKHILKDKSVKLHKELEEELLKKYRKKIPIPTLFEPEVDKSDQLKNAYKLHNKEIGWRSDKNEQNVVRYD